MSLQSWKEEFYPMRAWDTLKEAAAEHSLKKWIGLRSENLARHGLIADGSAICEEERQHISLSINDRTCALCKHYLRLGSCEAPCASCPIMQLTGYSCDDDAYHRENYGTESPYGQFLDNKNPEPMIALLERVVDYEKAKATS